MSYYLQATFSRGELDPELVTRPDLELFRAALAECENFITLKRGGFRRRGGTRYVGEVKDSGAGAWLMPFEFGSGQTYMLEAGNYYFRVYSSIGRVGSVEVTTPYSLAVLPDLKFVQSIDTLFVTGGGIRPQAIKRYGETSWAIEPMDFQDGPYLDVNITPTSLRPGGTTNPVPVMTSNTTPSGTVTSSDSVTEAYKVFARDPGKVVLSMADRGWVGYQFPNALVIDGYMLQAPNDNSKNDDMPAQWVIEASDNGTDWAVLDTQDGEVDWASSEWRRFSFANTKAYNFYRFRFTEGGGSTSDDTAIAQLVFHQAAGDQPQISLTASNTGGINGGAGFGSADIGRHIRLRGSDGYWRWAKIDAISSSTVAQVRIYGQSLLDTAAIGIWRLGSWSDRTGWPAAVGWHKNRLAFASTDAEPQTVWESQTDDFSNFAVSQPLVASDAVSVGILSGQVNRINWLNDDDDLLAGTSKAVRAIGKATSQDPYGPENVDQKPETNFGANGIQPIKVGSVLLYFGRYGTDLRELAYDLQSDGRASRSVSETQSHLFRPGIAGACYQQYPDSIIWPWDRDGNAIGFTYEREQQVFGMHRHGFGGVVECMAAIPGDGFDEVWMVVRRVINGQTRRYIEVMQKPFIGQPIEDAWHLDCAARYAGNPVNTVSGLGFLEGMDVILYADGSDYVGTVSDGAVSLPNGRTASKILIGLDVTARAKTLPPPVNAQDGASVGRKMTVDEAKISVFETGVLRVGAETTHVDAQIFYRAGDTYGEPASLRTGVVDADVELRWEDRGQLVFEASGGKPCTVLAVNYNLSMEP